MTYRPYGSLYDRLIANTAEPINERSCWVWTGKRGKMYGRFNLYVPGFGKCVILSSHVAMWVWSEASPRSIDDFYLAYLEFGCSGLELDHLCEWPDCISLDHTEPVTASENCKRREARRRVVR